MMVHDIVRRPHPLMRGHGDEELAARLELGRDRSDRRTIVVDMLDHVERSDEVVMAVIYSREFGERSAHHRPAETLLGECARFLVKLESVDMAELAEHREVVAGAAPDFQDAGFGRRADRA